MKKGIFQVFVLLTFWANAAAGFEAQVSATTVPEGESFQLYLRQDGGGENPDVSVLEKDFLIVGQRKSYKSTFINGRAQSYNENVLTLIPKTTGEVVLPAIRAGKQQTKPVKITVVAGGRALPEQPQSDSKQPNIYLRAAVDNPSPYVGQQIPLTVKLYANARTPLLDGTVTPPQTDGIASNQGGDPEHERETVNGKTYDVLTYKFLLFAQKSGKITLPPVQFRGEIADTDDRGGMSGDPFGFGGANFFSGFFGQKPVAARSDPIRLDVRPKPDFVTGDFMPATDVDIVESVSPDKKSVDLGETLTRTVSVTATGVPAAQIPDIVFPETAGFKQYPGKTETQNLFDKNGFVGVKTRQIVFMPTQTGRLVLPALKMPWFDVKTGGERFAELPARPVVVTGTAVQNAPVPSDAGFAVSQTPKAENLSASETKTVQTVVEDKPANRQNNAAIIEKFADQPHWRLFFAGIFAGAAVVTALWLAAYRFLFSKREKQAARTENPPSRESLKNLKSACAANAPDGAKAALLAWGRETWRDNPPLTLSALANRVGDGVFSEQIEKLNAALYANGGLSTWDGAGFWAVFQSVRNMSKNDGKREKIPVPPLYPN